jgi:hypothetical protein
MAVRFVALLIPLAITLPQLQSSRPVHNVLPPQPVVQVQPAPAPAPEWSYEPRLSADAPQTRVVLEAPAHEAMHSTVDSPTPVAALPAAPAAVVRKAPTPRATPRVVRTASLAKGTPTPAASSAIASRHIKRLALGAGCEPGAHCAPVEDAKVTLVNARAM